jgi:hypothetical protein
MRVKLAQTGSHAILPKNKRLIFRTSVLFLTVMMMLVAGCASFFGCWGLYFSTGVWMSECPNGEIRPTVTLSAERLRRGQDGHVTVSVTGHYTREKADETRTIALPRFSVELSLVAANEEVQLLTALKGWKDQNKGQQALIRLPEVPDGDYILRATVTTHIGSITQDLALPLYAPARVHLISDRPLYEPGNEILFRAVALSASDMHPFGERPGKWVVKDPNGQVMLEERTQADAWGVSSGSFPLDEDAATGTWSISWISGKDSGDTKVDVRPFTLPRFRVELAADKPWYRPGDSPVVRGQAIYSSGAPVADAPVQITWRNDGDWPWPNSWGAGALPKQAMTNRTGHFVLELPRIPQDLVGQSSMVGRFAVVDAAGDKIIGSLALLLSEHGIAVSALTEFNDGLVANNNNRLYLRVTTPEGTPLRSTPITVSRAWGDPKPIDTQTDVDGVAALQIDPGVAVTVRLPTVPLRIAPPAPLIARTAVRELVSGAALSLADMAALDRWIPKLNGCAKNSTVSSHTIRVALQVSGRGSVEHVTTGDTHLERCVARVIRQQRLTPGRVRLIEITHRVNAESLPKIRATISGLPTIPSEISSPLQRSMGLARACLNPQVQTGQLSQMALWNVSEGTTQIKVRWVDQPEGMRLSSATTSCIKRTLTGLRLEEPANDEHLGFVRLNITASPQVSRPSAPQRTKLGYAFNVEAQGPTEAIGSTPLIMDQGTVPSLRIRLDPVLAKPGETVKVAVLRGPGNTLKPPKHLMVHHERKKPIKVEIDKESLTGSFALPADAKGWYVVNHERESAKIFVRSDTALSVTLTPDKLAYSPGDSATLKLSTKAGDTPIQAAVGLIGVDNSLAQLVRLPGPDAMSSLRLPVKTTKPAFGVLEGQALTMGRIQGDNAAAATVMRVSQVPSPEETDRTVTEHVSGHFDPSAVLTDHFYSVLAQLHRETRNWERETKALLRPKAVPPLWDKAIAACTARGEPVDDAYGRTLRLSHLPDDLLALTAPRALISDATRVPEDVINWAAWVRKEQP